MNKAEFLEAKKEYESRREKFLGVQPGDIVFEVSHQPFVTDYFAAIVKSVNVDKTYITVIDVSDTLRPHVEKRYDDFMTVPEYIADQGKGSEEIIEDLRREHSGLIDLFKSRANRS